MFIKNPQRIREEDEISCISPPLQPSTPFPRTTQQPIVEMQHFQKEASNSSAHQKVKGSLKQYFEQRKSWTEKGFEVLLKPAVNRSLEEIPFISIFPEELFSGLYTYRIRITCSSHVNENEISARLLVPVIDCNNMKGQQVPVRNNSGFQTWQILAEKSCGLAKFELLSAFVNPLAVKQIDFNVQFAVNSHNFNKLPFIFQIVHGDDAVVFESQPFRIFARRPTPSSCFWTKNFCKNPSPSRKRKSVEVICGSSSEEEESHSMNRSASVNGISSKKFIHHSVNISAAPIGGHRSTAIIHSSEQFYHYVPSQCSVSPTVALSIIHPSE